MKTKYKIIVIILIVLSPVALFFLITTNLGDGVLEDIDLSKLSHYEVCVILSGEKGWNEEENSCLFFSGDVDDVEVDIDLCKSLGGQIKDDLQYMDIQNKNNTVFIECQFPIEIIDTQGK